MNRLSVKGGVDLPGNPVQHALGGHDVDCHVGNHEFNCLEVTDRLSKLDAFGRVGVSDFCSPGRGADAVRSDLQPGFYEPIFGQV